MKISSVVIGHPSTIDTLSLFHEPTHKIVLFRKERINSGEVKVFQF